MARPKGTIKFKYNEEQADRVERLAMIGCNDDHIAIIEKMSDRTLKTLYKKELQIGRAKGIGAVSKTLFAMAQSGKNPGATFFFLKCRAQWREVQRIEHTGADGKAIETKSDMVFETQWRDKVKPDESSS